MYEFDFPLNSIDFQFVKLDLSFADKISFIAKIPCPFQKFLIWF